MKSFGRYNLLCKLGEGGMGVLYLARQKTLKRFCGLKVIHPHLSKEKIAADRFLHEARSAASLTHQNLVSIYDCDEYEGQYFIAMEFVEGFSLREIIERSGALPIPLALSWCHQAAIGLQYLHQRDFVHRDIKPDNLMIDPHGVLKIMDFGLAKHHFEGDQSMTMSGVILGSPHYMSPEQVNESKDVDARSDLYSLGIVLYEMLVGKVPYSKTTAAGVMLAHMNEPIPSLVEQRPDLLPQFDEFHAKFTCRDLVGRISSATDLIHEMQSWMDQYPMDEESQECWREMDFPSRSVSRILQREQIDTRQLDATMGPEASVRQKGGAQTSIGFQIFATVAIVTLWIAFIFFRPAPQPLAPMALASLPPLPGNASAKPSAGPKLGGVFIKTKPTGAMVLFQAREKVSPASFAEVPVGRYPIKVYLDGFDDAEREIEVVEGKFVEVHIMLAPTLASVAHSGGTTPHLKTEVVERVEFNPLGKSILEIEEAWGKAEGRIDFEEETQLIYPQGRVMVRHGHVVDFLSSNGRH